MLPTTLVLTLVSAQLLTITPAKLEIDDSKVNKFTVQLKSKPANPVQVYLEARGVEFSACQLDINDDKPHEIVLNGVPVFDQRDPTKIPIKIRVYEGTKPTDQNYEITRKATPGGTCTSIGDPHYKTFDGHKFDFMLPGTYTFFATPDFEIQTTQTICFGKNAGPTCNQAIAIRYGSSVVALDVRHSTQLRQITGYNTGLKYTPPKANDVTHSITLPCGSRINMIVNTQATYKWIDITLTAAGGYTQTGGICNRLGNTNGLLIPRTGAHVPLAKAIDFCNSWKVPDSENLLMGKYRLTNPERVQPVSKCVLPNGPKPQPSPSPSVVLPPFVPVITTTVQPTQLTSVAPVPATSTSVQAEPSKNVTPSPVASTSATPAKNASPSPVVSTSAQPAPSTNALPSPVASTSTAPTPSKNASPSPVASTSVKGLPTSVASRSVSTSATSSSVPNVFSSVASTPAEPSSVPIPQASTTTPPPVDYTRPTVSRSVGQSSASVLPSVSVPAPVVTDVKPIPAPASPSVVAPAPIVTDVKPIPAPSKVPTPVTPTKNRPAQQPAAPVQSSPAQVTTVISAPVTPQPTSLPPPPAAFVKQAENHCNALFPMDCAALVDRDFYVQACIKDAILIGSLAYAEPMKMQYLAQCKTKTEFLKEDISEKAAEKAAEIQKAVGLGAENKCPNDCSGNGVCGDNGCRCNSGFGGADCATDLTKMISFDKETEEYKPTTDASALPVVGALPTAESPAPESVADSPSKPDDQPMIVSSAFKSTSIAFVLVLASLL